MIKRYSDHQQAETCRQDELLIKIQSGRQIELLQPLYIHMNTQLSHFKYRIHVSEFNKLRYY